VSASLETPKNLTFSELQTLIEQGETDEIPSNKPIADALNVGLVLILYHISMTVPLVGDPSQPVERSATPKALGARSTVRMTSQWDTSSVIYMWVSPNTRTEEVIYCPARVGLDLPYRVQPHPLYLPRGSHVLTTGN
jgi:hypothetical protein